MVMRPGWRHFRLSRQTLVCRHFLFVLPPCDRGADIIFGFCGPTEGIYITSVLAAATRCPGFLTEIAAEIEGRSTESSGFLHVTRMNMLACLLTAVSLFPCYQNKTVVIISCMSPLVFFFFFKQFVFKQWYFPSTWVSVRWCACTVLSFPTD